MTDYIIIDFNLIWNSKHQVEVQLKSKRYISLSPKITGFGNSTDSHILKKMKMEKMVMYEFQGDEQRLFAHNTINDNWQRPIRASIETNLIDTFIYYIA